MLQGSPQLRVEQHSPLTLRQGPGQGMPQSSQKV